MFCFFASKCVCVCVYENLGHNRHVPAREVDRHCYLLCGNETRVRWVSNESRFMCFFLRAVKTLQKTPRTAKCLRCDEVSPFNFKACYSVYELNARSLELNCNTFLLEEPAVIGCVALVCVYRVFLCVFLVVLL